MAIFVLIAACPLFSPRANPFLDLTIASVDEIQKMGAIPFTQIISVSDVEFRDDGRHEHLVGEFFPNARVLYSYFNDIAIPTAEGPTEREIARILTFSAHFMRWDKILVHCRAGVSRSTALAFAIACQHSHPGEERKAFAYIRKLRPQLLPNRLIVITADRLLEREGRMIAASSPMGF